MSANYAVDVPAESASVRDGQYQVEVTHDVRIQTEDPDVTLSGDLYRPVATVSVPALVMVLPYRKDAGGGVNSATFRWFAERGYACLLVDFLGTGSSDGTHRPPFHENDADDGVAAVEWAAAQPWCDGNVGMWGHSYGAFMSLSTAARRPPHLKAIVPVMSPLDPERDLVYPAGAPRIEAVASWGVHTLLNQVLPPLRDYASEAEQRRWRQRLTGARPWILDMFQTGPGDPAWRARIIDASAVTVPTFVVAGWRDVFCDPTVRAYEQIDAPKKLMVGPWLHTMPDTSPFQAIDFRTLCLRWWDHWLGGQDNGVMDELPVTLYRQGHEPQWLQFPSWPPAGANSRYSTGQDGELRPDSVARIGTANDGGLGPVVAEAVSDATVGVLSGQWSIPVDASGLPLDEHDDDVRALVCETAPLGEDLIIAGRRSIRVRLAQGCIPHRLVARLADVDPLGRSTLIADGAVASPQSATNVPLKSTYYRVAAGHRLRAVLSDAHFPWLWAGAETDRCDVLRLVGAEVTVPVAGTPGIKISVPARTPATDAQDAESGAQLRWMVSRDLVSGGVEVRFDMNGAAPLEAGHVLKVGTEMSAQVQPDRPSTAGAQWAANADIEMTTGETVTARATVRMRGVSAVIDAYVKVDDVTVYTSQWFATMPGRHPTTIDD